jgi:PEP-CTERM motif
MKLQRLILAGAVLAGGISTAQAETWAFSYTGPGITASGTFTTAGAALALEDILSISGTRNGVAITGLVPLDTDPNFTYDNQFTIGSPNFTEGGMLFSLAGGGLNTNVYFFGGVYNEVYVDGLEVFDTPITWNVTAVPEPATVLSMLAGLGLLGVYMRKARAQ